MPGDSKNYYYGIDLVRFCSAFLVAIFHIGFACWASPTSGGQAMLRNAYAIPELAAFSWFGWVGVEIFFVISGFVISSSAENATPFSFFRSRILRLYPGVWICATITALVLLINDLIHGVGRYLFSMALVPTGPFIDGQYWTLGVEIVFYTIIFLFVVSKAMDHVRLLAVVMALLSFMALAIMTVSGRFTFLEAGIWRLTLLNYGVYFALGMFIRQYFRNGLDGLSLFGVLLSLIGCILETRLHATGMSERVTNSPIILAQVWPVATAVLAIGIAAIFLSVKYNSVFMRLPPRFLPIIRGLGLATYPLYLIHFSVGIWITRELVGIGFPPILALGTTLGALSMFSWVIALHGEPPIRKALRAAMAWRIHDRAEAAG